MRVRTGIAATQTLGLRWARALSARSARGLSEPWELVEPASSLMRDSDMKGYLSQLFSQ